MIHRIGADAPAIHESCFIAPNAEVAGKVSLAEGVSVWHSASVRGDIDRIGIGKNSNVQDGAVIHCDHGMATVIGEGVTIGHGAIIHSAKIGNNTIIGMGAIVLNGAVIGEDSVVGAGALVTGGKTFPPKSLILGSPAKQSRELTDDEIAHNRANAEEYVKLAHEARTVWVEVSAP